MKIILLSLFAVLAGANESQKPLPQIPGAPESFECGIYQLSGKYRVNADGTEWLLVYPDTTREFSISMNKTPPRTGMYMRNELVQLEVEISEPASGSQTRAHFIKLIDLVPVQTVYNRPITKLKNLRHECREDFSR